jgi:hydroxyacylglutathione hydrolase
VVPFYQCDDPQEVPTRHEEKASMSVRVEILSTPELGDRSYIAHDGRLAVVIDPQRDLDRLDRIIAVAGLEVGLVVETHIHNDYVTGGYELAQRCGVPYAVNRADPVSFERLGVSGGDELEVGRLRVAVIATPGHTETHLSYAVSDLTDADCPPVAFTGGSLLFGSVGRTDLVAADRTVELTRAQYQSAQRLVSHLPDDTAVFPTHGFGSFCSSGSATGGRDSTIGHERVRNDALTSETEDDFVRNLVANLTAYPAYYAHMAPLNRRGPRDPELGPPAVADPDELAKRIATGEWVVDLRNRTAYAADHVAGSVSVELGPQFATYVGWLMPWGAPLTLLGEMPEQVSDAQRQLMRIGIDRLAGAAAGSLDATANGLDRGSYLRADFRELATSAGSDAVLDVRRDDEWAGGHIDGAKHIPLHTLPDRLQDVPDGRVWVHCATGFRAGIAASLLDRAGRSVVHVDDDYIQVTT